nr:DUF3408 domain-containing protein [uncultured Butyricimonas sp.]
MKEFNGKGGEIDELLLKQMIAGEESAQEPPQTVTKEKLPVKEEKSKKKKNDYRELFLKGEYLKERHCVYISQENYLRIASVVRLLNVVTVGNYLDNILSHHLEEFQRDIEKIVEDELLKYKQ